MYSEFINQELQIINNAIFQSCGLAVTNFQVEQESQEYAAQNFELGARVVKFRLAKITPTKIGQFVTLWQRTATGIAPFSVNDNTDLYIIATRREQDIGFFIFPKHVLFQKGILSGNEKDGKRGFRVYPPWDIAKNKQAQMTQAWQKLYFITLRDGISLDLEKARCLLQI